MLLQKVFDQPRKKIEKTENRKKWKIEKNINYIIRPENLFCFRLDVSQYFVKSSSKCFLNAS